MDIQTRLNDEAVRAYCQYLSHPGCCVQVLRARVCNEEILGAIEANHSITTLHINPHLDDNEIRRIIKHKDLYTLTVNGSVITLKPSPSGVIPTRVPYSELTIRNGFSSYVDIDPEPFLETASQLTSVKFFVANTNAAMVQTLFNRFATFSTLSHLSIGVSADEATVPEFWSSATNFARSSISIRKFTVRCHGVAHNSSSALIREITRNTKITHFSFTCDNIDDNLWGEIAAMIRTNTHLKRLKLHANQVPSDKTSIVEALRANNTLKKLTLCGFGDCYDYLTVLLDNSTITSFRTDNWDSLVKHCTVVAQILKRNIIRNISIPMRWRVDENDFYEALKSNTSLRRLSMNVELHPILKEKKLMSFTFAPFNLTQLNTAIEMVNLSPQWLGKMMFAFADEPSMVESANEFLAEKVQARTSMTRHWAVRTLQTLQLLTARDLGQLNVIPAEIRQLILRHTAPSHVMTDKLFNFIVGFSTREKLQELVEIHRRIDLSAYGDLVEDFLYNLLCLQ